MNEIITKDGVSRREFLTSAGIVAAGITIVPGNVMAGFGHRIRAPLYESMVAKWSCHWLGTYFCSSIFRSGYGHCRKQTRFS